MKFVWSPYKICLLVLFLLFLLMNGLFLTRLPGLMGDEASEGQDVYNLLHADHITIVGQRSYIGPAIDYVRVPFIVLFGYSTLGVRVLMLLFSIATFWLAASILKRLFGEEISLYGLVFLVFSPIYLTEQRLGWAITLLPFFALLIVYLVLAKRRQAPLLVGLAAGLGLANHIMFLGTLLGTSASLFLSGLKAPKKLLSYWPAIIGFWAGFGLQFAVLLLYKDDQGDTGSTTELFGQRLVDFPVLWPQIISGSSYIASYTGHELAPWLINISTWVIGLLALCSLGLVRKYKVILGLWLGLIIQLPVILYMVDRFSLRYFTVTTLWMWMLAGLGLGWLISLLPKFSWPQWKLWVPPALAGALSLWFVMTVWLPYFTTGGSTAEFSLGNRTDSASALVDIRPLLACIKDKGPVYSDVIHIYNRLLYLSYSDTSIHFVSDALKKQATLIVRYRLPADEGKPTTGELCPELKNFRVLPYNVKTS